MTPLESEENKTIAVDFDGLEEIDLGMSNFDRSIDEGFEEKIKSGPFFGRYSAWNFNGLVCFNPNTNSFICEVWVHHIPVEIIEKKSLKEIMDYMSEKYGYE